MLDHRFTKAHAFAYLDGELPAGDRRRVERHTAVCPQCRAVMASFQHLLRSLPALGDAGRPSVADSVVQRLRHEG
jgi:anti-sigma factor RsiW